jgi:hypothetical protein
MVPMAGMVLAALGRDSHGYKTKESEGISTLDCAEDARKDARFSDYGRKVDSTGGWVE